MTVLLTDECMRNSASMNYAVVEVKRWWVITSHGKQLLLKLFSHKTLDSISGQIYHHLHRETRLLAQDDLSESTVVCILIILSLWLHMAFCPVLDAVVTFAGNRVINYGLQCMHNWYISFLIHISKCCWIAEVRHLVRDDHLLNWLPITRPQWVIGSKYFPLNSTYVIWQWHPVSLLITIYMEMASYVSISCAVDIFHMVGNLMVTIPEQWNLPLTPLNYLSSLSAHHISWCGDHFNYGPWADWSVFHNNIHW